jgi:hypothetical protein
MVHWRNFFRGRDARTSVGSTQVSSRDLHVEYESLVARHVRQLGIPAELFELDVGAKSFNGRNVYNCKIRLVRWNRSASLRLLVSLPLLEARIRKAVGESWLGEVSQFGGLWVHSSSALQGAEVEGDSQWAISELQLFDNAGALAADRLRRDRAEPARRAGQP